MTPNARVQDWGKGSRVSLQSRQLWLLLHSPPAERCGAKERTVTSLSWAPGRHVWGVALAQQMQLADQTWGGTSQPSKIHGHIGAVSCLKSAHFHGHMGRSSQRLQHRNCNHCWVWDAEGRKGTGGREAAQPQRSPTTSSASLPIPG